MNNIMNKIILGSLLTLQGAMAMQEMQEPEMGRFASIAKYCEQKLDETGEYINTSMFDELKERVTQENTFTLPSVSAVREAKLGHVTTQRADYVQVSVNNADFYFANIYKLTDQLRLDSLKIDKRHGKIIALYENESKQYIHVVAKPKDLLGHKPTKFTITDQGSGDSLSINLKKISDCFQEPACMHSTFFREFDLRLANPEDIKVTVEF